MSKKAQHVMQSEGGGWRVHRSGASRASRTFATKSDAVRFARGVAKNEGSDVYTHRRDGMIAQKDSYGSDSNPPVNRKR